MRIEDVIAYRIATYRKAAGRTQAQVGEDLEKALGRPWPRQAVSNAEKGGRVFGAADLLGLAAVLGTTVELLLQPPDGVSTVEIGDDVSIDAAELLSLVSGRAGDDFSISAAGFTPRQRERVIELVEAVLAVDTEPTGVQPGKAPADLAERGTVLSRRADPDDDRSAGTA